MTTNRKWHTVYHRSRDSER